MSAKRPARGVHGGNRGPATSGPLLLLAMAFFLCLSFPTPGAVATGSVSGVISDHRGPLPRATVLVQGSSQGVISDAAGRFTLSGLAPGRTITISAWKDGYCNGLARNITPTATGLHLQLVPYQSKDNFQDEWLPPEGRGGGGKCHPALTKMSLKDPHLKAARNPRFLTMYAGTDTEGNRSPETRYSPPSRFWTNWLQPQRPAPGIPYYGPEYLLDFQGTPGNCAACHVPGVSTPGDGDPRKAKDANKYGVHCDFCHKIGAVNLHPLTKMPHVGAPGVRSLEIRSPFENDSERTQLFFGTFADVNTPANDAYLPLLKESRFCAPCHFGVFWDTVLRGVAPKPLQRPQSGAGEDLPGVPHALPHDLQGQETH